MSVPRPNMNTSYLACASDLFISADAPIHAIPITSLCICVLLVTVYVGSLYLAPFLVQKVAFFGRIGESWTKIFGTLVSSLFAIFVARLCMVLVPPPKPNCLVPAQILGLSFSVDSVWWDFCLPIVSTVVMISPLMLANIMTTMFTSAAVGGKGMGQSFARQIFWYFARYLPSVIVVSIRKLLTGHPFLHQSLIFGPLAEELTFRAAIISILRITGGWSIHIANLSNALLFSLSHAHSLLLHLATSRSIPSDISSDLTQCTFTGLFALLVGHIFIRSRCIWTCVVVHIVCNVVGFPDMDLVMMLPSPIVLGLGMMSGLTTALTFYLLRRL